MKHERGGGEGQARGIATNPKMWCKTAAFAGEARVLGVESEISTRSDCLTRCAQTQKEKGTDESVDV